MEKEKYLVLLFYLIHNQIIRLEIIRNLVARRRNLRSELAENRQYDGILCIDFKSHVFPEPMSFWNCTLHQNWYGRTSLTNYRERMADPKTTL